MPRDIRSYFGVKPAAPKPASSPVKKKTPQIVISDDEEEGGGAKPTKKSPEKKERSTKEHSSSSSNKRRIIDSDEEDGGGSSKKNNGHKKLKEGSSEKSKPKLKEVDVSSVFGNAPVKRVERPKPKKKDLFGSDDEDDKLLAEIDLDEIAGVKKESPKTPPKKEEKPKENKTPPKNDTKTPTKASSKVEEKKSERKGSSPSSAELASKEKKKRDRSPSKDKSAPSKKTSSASKPKKQKKEPEPQEDEYVLTDQDKWEKKRANAALWKQRQNRAGPSNPGSKEIPKGKPNCLTGLTFIITGTLESMERDEAAQVIKDCGGKVVTSVSKKLSYMVVGEEAGPSKLAKAEEFGINTISEDDLLDLIREKSGLPKKQASVVKSPKKEVKVEKKAESSPKKSESKPPKASPIKPKITDDAPSTSSATPPTKIVKAESTPVSTQNLAWVEKYKPTSVKQIVGQQGAASNAQKLMNWLSKWHSNHDGKKKLTRPSPWLKNDDGSFYKAALLSGPPGVGKTTTATLVCQELGFDAVEFNASDTRSKKLLKAEVAGLLSNQSLTDYVHGNSKKTSGKHVLIMDEVDGMAGNEDRGGIGELIQLIKDSHVPIICMCNDRNHQKMRSLVNHCYDLRFQKPRLEQIRGAMMSVCFKEGIKLPSGAIDDIISGTGNDLRQTLNHLSMYGASKELSHLTKDQIKQESKTAEKDIKIGPWDVIRKVFSYEEHKNMDLNDKASLFFHDYSMAPLFVQENYLGVKPRAPVTDHMRLVAMTADSLSISDLVDKRIRSSNAWSLLPTQAMFSSVLPGEYLEGNFVRQINFPAWLGKNSKQNKLKRLAQEIHDHTRVRTSGSRQSVRLDYAAHLIQAIVKPLKDKEMDGVHDSLEVLKEYRLLREDIDALVDLTAWPKQKSLMDGVDGKVKAALTRAYNKEVQPYTYSAMNVAKKKKIAVTEEFEGMDGDDEVAEASDEEKDDDDDIENNAFIKVKKPAAVSKAKSSKTGSSASTSKEAAKGGKAKGESKPRGKGKK